MPVWGRSCQVGSHHRDRARKNPNGEVAIRCHLIASSAGTLPTAEAASASIGSVCRSVDFHRFCSCRRTCLRRDWPKARRSGGGRTCFVVIAVVPLMLALWSATAAPSPRKPRSSTRSPPALLVPGNYFHIRRAGFNVVFLMDRALLVERGADGVGEFLGDFARIVEVAGLPQTIDRHPVQRSPAEGQID